MAAFLSKYGVARHIYVPMIKRGVVDFAVGADWTPAAGDVKISKDGGAAANVSNLPTAITMGNTAMWDFSITATELQAAQVMVTVADSATKAVEDTQFDIETYGNASAQHALDLSVATQPVNLTQILGTALTETAGQIAAAFKKFFDKGSPTGTINSLPDAVPGAAGGVFIAGTNAPVIITGSGPALTLASTGANGQALYATAHGSGAGIQAVGGSSAGQGMRLGGGSGGIGFLAEGGAGAWAGSFVGGGSGLYIKGTGAAHGLQIEPGASGGHGLVLMGAAGVPLLFNGAQIGSTGNSDTAVHLPGLDYPNDALVDHLLVITDNSASDKPYLRWIEGWNNTSKLATVASLGFVLAGGSDRAAVIPITRRDVTFGSVGRTAIGLAAANLDTQLAAIDVKTTNLPSDPADQSLLIAATNTLATDIADVEGKVDDLEGRLTASLATKLTAHAAAVLTAVIGSGSTTTAIKLSTVEGAAPSAVNDFYNGAVLVFTSGVLAGQRTAITDYDGATTTATVAAVTSAPANTDTGVIV